jgi:hypothetical protein
LTIKDLRKWLSDVKGSNVNNNNQLLLNSEKFTVFRKQPFWLEPADLHMTMDSLSDGNCCFNHIIGLSKKDGEEKKIFDYEMDLVNTLNANKSVWIKKSRGLGITELILRYMAWLCV